MNIYPAFTLLFGLLLMQACHGPAPKQKDTPLDDTLVSTDSLSFVSKDSNMSASSAPADRSKGQVFLVRNYRIWEKEDPTAVLNSDWYDLYEREGKYYLDKVDYEIKNGYDDCAGVPSKSVESKRNSLLFLHIKGLKAGPLDHIPVSHSEIWPKESVTYTFKNQVITLKATGDIKSTEVQTDEKGHERVFHQVVNYKLSYSYGSENNAYPLFHIDQYDGVFMSTRFVGDIDRDGKIDIIFSNPSNYEEEAVLLFLSNHGNTLIFEAAEQFDC